MDFAPLLSITINIDPILLQVGPLAVRWYGLMYVVGIFAGLYVAMPYARQRGLIEDQVWSVFWWGLIGGLIGARLYFVAQSDPISYVTQPWRVFAMWEGGMAFYGAIAGGVIALALACRRAGMHFWTLADAAALFAALGQGFGRIGNIVNGDIVGYATDLPWGVVYTHPRSFVADHTIAYQPAAFYELIFNAVLFAALWSLRFRLRRPGVLFATYIILYSLGQFLLFFVRDNEIVLLGLKNAQLTSLVVMALGVPLWLWLRGKAGPEVARQAADLIAPSSPSRKRRGTGRRSERVY